MSERSAFMSAIIANPDDDTARLVFADWLEEQGEGEAATLIRVLVAIPPGESEFWQTRVWGHMAAIAPAVHGSWSVSSIVSGISQFRGRARGLKVLLPPVWFFQDTDDGDGALAIIDRGFVSQLICSAADFLAHADALMWHPAQNRPCPETAQPIRRVKLTTMPEVEHSAHQSRLVGDAKWFTHRQMTDEIERTMTTHPFALNDDGVLLRLRWPGVEFELPTIEGTGHYVGATWSLNNVATVRALLSGDFHSLSCRFEGSVDGSNWFLTAVVSEVTGAVGPEWSDLNSAHSWLANVSGLTALRVRGTSQGSPLFGVQAAPTGFPALV